MISIIVPVASTNRVLRLRALLESLQDQDGIEIELIAVGRNEVLDSIGIYRESLGFRLRTEVSPRPGASIARNIGASKASGDMLAFLDDDVILSKGWAKAAVTCLRDESTVGVTGKTIPFVENRLLEVIPLGLRWVIGGSYWLPNLKCAVTTVAGMNVVFKRDAFFLVGGYNTLLGPREDRPELANWQRLGAEEAELALRLINRTAKRIVYNPDMVAYHVVSQASLTSGSLARRAMHVGHNRAIMRHYTKKFMVNSSQAEKALLCDLVRHWTISMRKPFRTLGNFAMAALIFGFFLLGYTVGLLRLTSNRSLR